jgi:hypothetical protein
MDFMNLITHAINALKTVFPVKMHQSANNVNPILLYLQTNHYVMVNLKKYLF